MISLLRFSALAVALSIATSASAITVSYNFDSATAGSLASAFNTADFSFHSGFYDTLKDSFGDPIEGSAQWQIDPENPALVDNPSLFGYGAAPSGSFALQVVEQTVLIRFAYDVDIQSFSVTLDNSGFGNGPSSIDFVNGASLLASIQTNQSALDYVQASSGPVSGVRTIVLPTIAFYDDLNFSFTASAVPEPSTYAACAGMAGLAVAVLRRRHRAV